LAGSGSSGPDEAVELIPDELPVPVALFVAFEEEEFEEEEEEFPEEDKDALDAFAVAFLPPPVELSPPAGPAIEAATCG